MWRRLEAAGDIYEAEYDGMYCVGCEEWKTEDEVVIEGGEKLCPIHRKPVERVKEKNYFFRLSKYEQELVDWYSRTPSPIQPESRRNEVDSFVRGGLRDISVSRTACRSSGASRCPAIPSTRSTSGSTRSPTTSRCWAAPTPSRRARGRPRSGRTSHHLIAKDILRFHAVYWPAMLWSAGLAAPKRSSATAT